MIQIMCWLDAEDYMYLSSIDEKNLAINYYGYMFEVTGGSETMGGSTTVKLMVIELINAKLAVGFALPSDFKIDGEFRLGFISYENPTKDIPIVCKLSKEVKRASYMGDDNEKLEYIGFSLEKFYENKDVRFYLHDLRGSHKPAE